MQLRFHEAQGIVDGNNGFGNCAMESASSLPERG